MDAVWGNAPAPNELRAALRQMSLTLLLITRVNFWALVEAFLWLRDESGDDKSVSVTFVYDSEVAKGLVNGTLGHHNRILN